MIILTIIFLIAIIFIGFAVGYMVGAHGFVMTQNLTEEGRILELCMNLDAYIPNCEDMYGGKNYGDRFE